LRHHVLNVAFFNGKTEIYESRQIIIKNVEETVIEYDGSKKPAAIFLNNND